MSPNRPLQRTACPLPLSFPLGRMIPAHIIAFAIVLTCPAAFGQAKAPSSAAQLAELINTYRVEQGLDTIPLSKSLTAVAEAHVQDLERNPPVGTCNGHSWSPEGQWTACCYTGDHASAQCMWDKPREITRGAYKGAGFEIVYRTSGRATPEGALRSWKGSPGHHGVILNHGVWSSSRWLAVGVAISDHYAVAWFGKDQDSGSAR